MHDLHTLFQAILPWLLFMAFILICLKMIDWARHRKAGAIAFDLFFQVFLPDPKAQVTIEMVVELKQEVKKQQDGDKKPKEDSETQDLL